MNKLRIKKIIVALFFAFIVYGFIEPYFYYVKETTIQSTEIPANFNGFKIIFITDIHHNWFSKINNIKHVVNKINNLQPDVILLGGDYTNGGSKYVNPLFNELKQLKAKFGVFGVLGNHDNLETPTLSKQEMKNAGIINLDNKSTFITINGEKIKIGGVVDFWSGYQNLTNTTKDINENDFVVLLSHNPDYVEEIRNKYIDLVLSGHTHGGQITFFGLFAPLIPSRYFQKYRTGLIKTEFTQVLVSNGIGEIFLPIRFFAPPQINLIHLRRK